MRIDAGILETVVALNMLWVATRQSCGGHLSRGLPYPWVDIRPDLKQKFLRYLLQFYTEQPPADFDRVLVFHGSRVRSLGADFVEFLSQEELSQKLQAYQEEMQAFTRFMKSQLGLS